jgi:hypothetical protein
MEENKEEYKSLYEYRGKSHPTIGPAVYAAAVKQGVKVLDQQVSTPKYNGKILTYPVSFLDRYFNPTTESTKEYEDNELPF